MGREPTAEDVIIRLYSLAFPYQFSKSDFYDSNNNVIGENLDRILGDTSARSWEDIPYALSHLAAWYTEDEGAIYTRDIGTLFGGLLNRLEQPDAWSAVSYEGNPARKWVYVGPEGMPSELIGSNEDGNIHHWAWMVVAGGSNLHMFGEIVNTAREFTQVPIGDLFSPPPDFYSDVALGNAGVIFGRRVSQSGFGNLHHSFFDGIYYWGNYAD